LDVFAAVEGQIVEIAPCPAKGSERRVGAFQADMSIEPVPTEWSVLLGIADTKMASALSRTIRADGIRAKFFSDVDEARTLIAKDRPSLAILEHDPPRIDGMEMCRAIRQQENDREGQLPVVMVAALEDQASGAAAGVTDWLIKPFTGAYARTKIRAWVLRTACQWIRTGVAADERRRSSERVTSSDKSVLLWMYGREIAPFETATFSRKLGDIIARATSTPQKRAAGA
jgi:DNA-binding response OmpR family regulator